MIPIEKDQSEENPYFTYVIIFELIAEDNIIEVD